MALPMIESEFWDRLEYRLCSELAGMASKDLRALWCDGIVARHYVLDDAVPRIVGFAWMASGGREQEQWDFALFLGPVPSQGAIEWAPLLPPEGATGWLEVNRAAKTIRVHSAYATRA